MAEELEAQLNAVHTKDLPTIYHAQMLTHAWFVNPFHSCELLRKFNSIYDSAVVCRLPLMLRLCTMVVLNVSDNLQAVFSTGASVVTSLSPTL